MSARQSELAGRKTRRELSHLMHELRGFLHAPELKQKIAEIIGSLEIIATQAQGRAVMFFRAGLLALGEQRVAEIEVRLGETWTQGQRLLKQEGGRDGIALGHQGHAEIVVEIRIVRSVGQRLAQQLHATVQVAGLTSDDPERAQRPRMSRIAS